MTADGSIILGEGVDITLTGSSTNSSISAITANANGNTITLNSGATLNRLATVSSGTVTLKGAGTYNMGASTVANVAGLTDTTWTGTVVLDGATVKDFSGAAAADGNPIRNLGNAGSSIELTGVSGWIASTINTKLILTDKVTESDSGTTTTSALTLNNGGSSTTADYTMATFSQAVSGTGTLTFDWGNTDAGYTGVEFQGDLSGWIGKIEQIDGRQFNVKLTKDANAVNVALANTSTQTNGKLHLIVDTTDAATFSKTVSVDNVNLKQSASFTDTLTAKGDITVASGKSLTAATLNVGSTLTVTGADGTNGATLTGATESAGTLQQTEGGITLSNMALENAKLTGAAAGTAVTLQDVSGAATLATGAYTVNAVAGAATAAADEVYLNYTLGGITGLTLNSDATLTIDAGDVSTAVGDAESFTLVFTLGENGISLYDTTWTAETLAGVITFGGELGEWLAANADTEYTLADGIATLALDSALTPSVTYNINGNVLSSITVKGSIPEPTTATLSLLALAALAARRRRR